MANYNPLARVSLPGADLTKPGGLIVVVGPNSSGKTLFLKDVERYLLTGGQRFIVCTEIIAQKPPDIKGFIDELIVKKYLQPAPQSHGLYRTYLPFLRPQTPQDPSSRQMFSIEQLREAYHDFPGSGDPSRPSFFTLIGMTLVAQLTLDQRRLIPNRTPSFEYRTATPDLPLQGLSVNSEAQELLAKETGEVFGNAAWLDISETGFYQLRVSNSLSRPPVGDMINPFRARDYAPIENEGDGFRSYVGICLSLLVASRPVALIDEPELCLHPPQAYHMGRFIGRYAKPEHVTIVATHSSHLLRGILETAKKVTLLRLTRTRRAFRGCVIEDSELVDSLRNPRVRAEAILDGVFSKGVVLVESEGDREEYQAAAEAISDYPSREVHFVPVGGIGGFAQAVRLYRALSIPVAVVADIDMLCDVDKAQQVIRMLCRDAATAEGTIRRLQGVAQLLKSQSPVMSEASAKEELHALSSESWDWTKGDDNVLRRRINIFANKLRRIHRLKEGGVAAYRETPEIASGLLNLLSECSLFGLFLVPVGELEEWARPLMTGYSNSDLSKTDRAAIAAHRIREAENRTGDIWKFIGDVLDYLRPAST